MEPLKSLKLFVFFQIICFSVFTPLFSFRALPPLATLALALFAQAAILVYLYFAAIRPLGRFEAALKNSLLDDRLGDSLLAAAPDDAVYLREICRLVERSVAYHIQKSSAEMFDRQAELSALQSQINPHFLYNTLESIRGQALIDDNIEIAKMAEALASFFRYSISRKGSLVTLRDELANIKNYMTIQRYRFNNRFLLEIHMDEEDESAYDCLVPTLIVQPVVENAIYHGLEDVLEDGKIIIDVVVTQHNLILTVSDNGKGMDGATLKALSQRIRQQGLNAKDETLGEEIHMGIALPNIQKRIQLLFGKHYGLQIYSTLGQGTDVEITVPANVERNMD